MARKSGCRKREREHQACSCSHQSLEGSLVRERGREEGRVHQACSCSQSIPGGKPGEREGKGRTSSM